MLHARSKGSIISHSDVLQVDLFRADYINLASVHRLDRSGLSPTPGHVTHHLCSSFWEPGGFLRTTFVFENSRNATPPHVLASSLAPQPAVISLEPRSLGAVTVCMMEIIPSRRWSRLEKDEESVPGPQRQSCHDTDNPYVTHTLL